MRKRGWLIWFGSALMVGGAAFLTWYGWMLHERTAAQRRAKEWLSRATAIHAPAPMRAVHSGDVGIAAHRDTFFRPLRGIRTNDIIALTTPAGTSRYAVIDTKIVRPSEV